MQNAKKKYLTVSLLPLVLSCILLSTTAGCDNINSGFYPSSFGMNANTTPINSLKKEQNSTEVYIKGRVEKVVPLLQKQQVYQVNDETGKIWVVTNRTSIRAKDNVTVKGILRYKSIPLGGNELGEIYLEEE